MSIMFPALVTPVEDLLAEMEARTRKGHPRFYKPFTPQESQLLRDHHAARALALGRNPAMPLYSLGGTQIATGFSRLVIGDYGAYLEIQPWQICPGSLRPKFGNAAPLRPVKYIWLTTRKGDIKVYQQLAKVAYADYLPNHYYVDPNEVTQVCPE